MSNTDITVVLDRSGSMGSVVDDTIGGFNTFLKKQQEQEGACALTLVQFDHEYEYIHRGCPIKDCAELNTDTYSPRGMTALLDALGRTINETGERIRKLDKKDQPERVLFVIITDGQENASKEFARDRILEMIKHQTDKYEWDFIYLGANQDAIEEARSIGIFASNTMNFLGSKKGTRSAFGTISSSVANYRSAEVKTSGGIISQEDRDAYTKEVGDGGSGDS